MCFKSPQVDNTAMIQQQQESAEARRREEERQARIRAGTARIDEIFNGRQVATGTFTPRQATFSMRDILATDPALRGVQGTGFDPTRLTQYGLTEGYDGTPGAPGTAPQRGETGGAFYRPDSGAVDNRGAGADPGPQVMGDNRGAPGGQGQGRRVLRDAAGNVVWSEDRGFNPDQQFSYTAQDPVMRTEGGFDDAYFNNRNRAVMDFYTPQLNDRFTTARNNLTYSLARAGSLNSSMAGEEAARLGRERGVQFTGIQSRAANEENALRTRVQNEKSQLVSQLNATGDADRAANDATMRTQTIAQETPKYDSLGDIFAGFTQGVGQYFGGQNEGRTLAAYGGGSPRRESSRTVTS